MNPIIKTALPTAEAIAKLLHPHAEVVIHDIEKNEIAAIYNPFSNRRVGDDSLLTQEEIPTLSDCVGPYEKTNWDGRKLKATSSILRDGRGRPVAMLCINLDVSKLAQFQEVLATFLRAEQLIPQPAALFKDDWQERVNRYIHNYLQQRSLVLDSLKRREKHQLIEHLRQQGAFAGKHAAHYIAQVIGISRATVYNYLNKR